MSVLTFEAWCVRVCVEVRRPTGVCECRLCDTETFHRGKEELRSRWQGQRGEAYGALCHLDTHTKVVITIAREHSLVIRRPYYIFSCGCILGEVFQQLLLAAYRVMPAKCMPCERSAACTYCVRARGRPGKELGTCSLFVQELQSEASPGAQ